MMSRGAEGKYKIGNFVESEVPCKIYFDKQQMLTF